MGGCKLANEVDDGGHPHPRNLGIAARSSISLPKASGGYSICGAWNDSDVILHIEYKE